MSISNSRGVVEQTTSRNSNLLSSNLKMEGEDQLDMSEMDKDSYDKG